METLKLPLRLEDLESFDGLSTRRSSPWSSCYSLRHLENPCISPRFLYRQSQDFEARSVVTPKCVRASHQLRPLGRSIDLKRKMCLRSSVDLGNGRRVSPNLLLDRL